MQLVEKTHLKLIGGFLVERVVGVGLKEEVLKAVDDGVDRQDWFPVLAEDVKTYVALQVYVRMIHLQEYLVYGRLTRSKWLMLSSR